MTIRERTFIGGEDGASAVEFALVALVFVGVILGVMGLGVMFWTNTTLHYAAEDAARCAVVKTTICTSAATTRTYAANHYMGPAISPVFTATKSGCGAGGWTVTGSANYPLNTGLFSMTIPISATSCFP